MNGFRSQGNFSDKIVELIAGIWKHICLVIRVPKIFQFIVVSVSNNFIVNIIIVTRLVNKQFVTI
jgi:hypothetical protein